MPCDGTQTNFEFSFPGGYIDASHVSVTTVDTITGAVGAVAFTLSGPSTVTVTPAPAATKILRIRRLTPMDAPLIDFISGATVNETNLDTIVRQSIFAAADAADTGTIAANTVRADAEALRLWDPMDVAVWLNSSLLTTLPVTFKGLKGDTGDDSVVPGPVGPAPALTIGNVTNIATGGAATADLRPNGTGAYLLDLGLPIGATGSGASVSWGAIGGSLASQTDLVTALAAKSDTGHGHSFASLTATPTTLAGYGIADALLSANFTFANLGGKPTTLAGYGITDAAASVHTHAWTDITSTPTTLAGYGITNGVTTTQLNNKADLTTAINSFSTNQTVSDASHNGEYNKMTGATGRTITFGSTPGAGHESFWVNRGTVAMTIACAGGYYKNGAATTATTNLTLAVGGRVSAFHEGAGVWTFDGTGF